MTVFDIQSCLSRTKHSWCTFVAEQVLTIRKNDTFTIQHNRIDHDVFSHLYLSCSLLRAALSVG